MKQEVSKVCQSTYLELRRISSVRHVLTDEATKTLVTSLVLPRLDYCNSPLWGMPHSSTDFSLSLSCLLARSLSVTRHTHTFSFTALHTHTHTHTHTHKHTHTHYSATPAHRHMFWWLEVLEYSSSLRSCRHGTWNFHQDRLQFPSVHRHLSVSQSLRRTHKFPLHALPSLPPRYVLCSLIGRPWGWWSRGRLPAALQRKPEFWRTAEQVLCWYCLWTMTEQSVVRLRVALQDHQDAK